MSTTPQTASTPPRSSNDTAPDTIPANPSSSPGSHHRRSPPPPKLNLDDCKPIITTTTTNTSTHTACRPSRALVFTSSRTLRNLYNYNTPPTQSTLLPPTEISEPSNAALLSNVTAGESSRKHGHDKPKLSPAQLERHSAGALDARCIVSANMRAAGFVPLTHSPSSSVPSTPSVAPVPTPKYPPRFPPVVFVNPTEMTNIPMWDYQRRLAFGLGRDAAMEMGSAPANDNCPSSLATPSYQSPSKPPSGTISSNHSYSSDSSSSLFSVVSGLSSNVTSVPSSAPQSPTCVLKSAYERFEQHSSAENDSLSAYQDDLPGVHGYPFPRHRSNVSPPDSSLYGRTTTQRSSSATASPAVSYTSASGSVTPLAQSPPTPLQALPLPPVPPTHSEPTPVFTTNLQRPTAKPIQEAVPTFRSKLSQEPQRKQKRRDHKKAAKRVVSLTELCSDSPFVWYTNPLLLPPEPFGSSSGSQSSSSVSSRTSSVVQGRGKSTGGASAASLAPSGLRAASAAPIAEEEEQEKSDSLQRVVEGVDHIDLAEKKQLAEVAVDDSTKDNNPGSEKSSHRGRQRDRDTDREIERAKKRERRRLKDEMKEAQSDKVHLVASCSPSLPSSGTASPSSDHSRFSSESKKDKGKGKSSRVEASGYTDMFPPNSLKPASKHAHVLGSYDAALAKERKRDAGEAAKDRVLAHRERDREHARLTSQWSLSDNETEVVQKKLCSKAMTLADMMSMHASSSTSESSARGRGRGRGEHRSTRGHSVSSVTSVLSDGETVVGDGGNTLWTDAILEG